MKLKVLKNGYEKNLILPAKDGDVGYDIKVVTMNIVGKKTEDSEFKEDLDSYWYSIDYIEYNTGLCVEPKTDYPDKYFFARFYAQVKPRSSISKYNLSLCNSVATIDPCYRGVINCRFNYLFQPEDLQINKESNKLYGKININKIYREDDKCAQIVFANIIHPNIEYCDNLSQTERDSSGFGSTDKVILEERAS